ncbi:MAG: PH domain-containing protein [Saprospiraceae bacterium]|nr:PH domain-containing protein [Saprospiraceae bacterium]
MSEVQPFSQPTRQSSAAIIFILGRFIKMLGRQFWPVILVFFLNRKSSGINGYTLFFLGLAGFSALISLLNYFKLYFYIKDDELVLEKGVFRKSKINVPLDRVQTVNFRQTIIHQFLNVVAVDIDTAGSSRKEFSLHALSKPQAELLREVVTSWQSAAQHSAGRLAPLETGLDTDSAAPSVFSKLLFQLTPLDLAKIGMSQNHLRTAGILFAFFASFADDVKDALGIDLEKKLTWWLGTSQGWDILLALLMVIPVFLLGSFFFTMVRTVLQYFGLRFWRTERGFKIESGLFTRQEVSAVLTKIQYVLWSSSPLMRLFNMMKVRMPQAASVDVTGKLAVGLPGCYAPQLEAVRAAYFPEENAQNWEPHGVDGIATFWRFLRIGLLPTAVLILITRSWLQNGAFIWLLWLPIALWLANRYRRSWQWEVSDEGLRAQWGTFNRTAVLLQWHKVQAVSVRKAIFTKRATLARLTLYTAAGDISVPYIPFEKAQAVQDFVLFKVESGDRAWM